MKLKELFSRAFFYTRLGYGSYLNWWIGAIAYITIIYELVKDGYNGYLFSDINEVPDLIGKIMKDYESFSYNAWQHSQNFTYEKFKERYLRILNEYKKVRR